MKQFLVFCLSSVRDVPMSSVLLSVTNKARTRICGKAGKASKTRARPDAPFKVSASLNTAELFTFCILAHMQVSLRCCCEKYKLGQAKLLTALEICKAMQLFSPPSHYLRATWWLRYCKEGPSECCDHEAFFFFFIFFFLERLRRLRVPKRSNYANCEELP